MNRDSIYLPRDVIGLLQTLQSAGHTAYVVGGCVRDSLLGRTPGDWDICTSARPEEMRRLFADHQLILTGEKHGTVAVVLHGKPYEMTTYRLDGNYHDHRHPDAVQFVDDLPRDLARRDFTINAMAYAPGKGIIDLYGGRDDLAAGMIRCVGDPAQRFAEDALRILRALRFSARLGFALDEATAAAALQARDTLQSVSAERIYTEIDGLLGAPNAGPTRRDPGWCGARSAGLHRLHPARPLALLRCVAALGRGGGKAGPARPGYPRRAGAVLGSVSARYC